MGTICSEHETDPAEITLQVDERERKENRTITKSSIHEKDGQLLSFEKQTRASFRALEDEDYWTTARDQCS